MFQLIRPDLNIDFMGKRYLWMAISGVALVVTFVLMATRGINYGIDFTGGAEVQVQVPATWEIGKVRNVLEQSEIKGLKVTEIAQENPGAPRQFLVKAQGDEGSLNLVSKQVSDAFGKELKAGEFEIQRVDVVGPAAGSSLRKSGYLSMLYALICILIYVTIRFDIRYSPGAVLALFHDAIITLGVFIALNKQFDLQILAAILALIGYSNNDTIIVYDRVRETMQLNPGVKVETLVNRAINETLARTLLTTVSTLLTVVALWLFGGPVIHDFAFALMVGMIAGSYSSIFVASSIVVEMTHYRKRREARAKATA